jgi:hypothetical protein
MAIENDVVWLKAHHVLLFFVLVVVAFLGHRTINLLADRAQSRATIAEQALSTQKTQDNQLAVTVAQVQQQYQILVKQLSVQNASLANAVVSRSGALQVQQGSDTKLPPSGLAERIVALSNAPSGTVLAVGKTVVLTETGAVAVTQSLEELPVLKSNLNDINNINSNLTQELSKSTTLVTALDAQVTGLTLQVKDQDKACKTEIASVKAQARKSKLRWFGAGVIVGIFLGHGGL